MTSPFLSFATTLTAESSINSLVDVSLRSVIAFSLVLPVATAKADTEASAMNSRRDSPRFSITADCSVDGGLRSSRMPGIIPACTLFTVTLPHFQPLPLSRARAPFSHPDWLFEIKWDGFRALLHFDNNGVRLISRNGNTFKSFPGLCAGLARDLKCRHCVLDGEIVCLDAAGKPQFRDLLFRRAEPLFYAFDLLWDEHAKSDDEKETLCPQLQKLVVSHTGVVACQIGLRSSGCHQHHVAQNTSFRAI